MGGSEAGWVKVHVVGGYVGGRKARKHAGLHRPGSAERLVGKPGPNGHAISNEQHFADEHMLFAIGWWVGWGVWCVLGGRAEWVG